MSKVFIPQIPSRFDSTGTRLWIPTINIQPAQQFGELVECLPPNANRLHTAPLVAALREKMADITADDYIVAVGDPSLIAAAACIMSRKTGGTVRMLKWDRISSAYIPVELTV